MLPRAMTVHPATRTVPGGAAWLVAVLTLPAAHAQAQGSGLTIVPVFSVTETLTSNRDLVSTGAQSDAITTLSPGIRIDSRSGRVQGSLAYTLDALYYARAPELNNVRNALNAAFIAEVVEQHAFVNASASISRQNISAYGTQGGGDTGLINTNQTDVTTLAVSPTVRGNLAGLADFSGGLNWVSSRSNTTLVGDTTSYGGQLGLASRHGQFGWGLTASRETNEFKLGRTTTTDQYGGTLTYFPQYDLKLWLNFGREGSNVLTLSPLWTTTSGLGAIWQPTERTNLSLQGDRTYYGQSHSYVLTHRAARSVWSYLDTASVPSPGAQSTGAPLTLYDLFKNICVAAGGDATGCDASVRATLAQQGLSPGAVVAGGFLNSSLTRQHNQNFSVSYAAQRSTFTLSLLRTSTSALGQVAAGSIDLAQGAPVRQQTASLGASHQLTPESSMTLTATQQKTLDAGALAGNQLRGLTLSWTTRLGPRTSASLSARHTQSTGGSNGYDESALIGSLSARF